MNRNWAVAAVFAASFALGGCSGDANDPAQARPQDSRVVDLDKLDDGADATNPDADPNDGQKIDNGQVSMPGPDEVNPPVPQSS